MNYIYLRDKKDREFEIEYSITKGRRAMFDPNWGNWFPSDPDEIHIHNAAVYFTRGKKTKSVMLTEKQLYNYIRQDHIEDMISEIGLIEN